MFAQPRAKKTLEPPPKKRKAVHAIEEITFDDIARADYLTGFRKRKQARIKHAQELAAERARKERTELRKQLREERKKEVEQHVEQVNALLREARNAGHDQAEDSDDDSDIGWDGFPDDPLPLAGPMNFEEEYIDEDKYTTVTIESVNIDRDGLHRPDADSSGDEDAVEQDGKQAEPTGEKRGASKENKRPKKKKKKFRYESKIERQLTERKQKAKRVKR